MTSKPSTPLEHRRPYPGEAENTRIPRLSPQPFRRAYSLRMRSSQTFHDYQQFCDTFPSGNDSIMPHLANSSKSNIRSSHKHNCSTCTCALSSSSLDIKPKDYSHHNGFSGHIRNAGTSFSSSLTGTRKNSLQHLQKNGRSMSLNLSNTEKCSQKSPKTPSDIHPGHNYPKSSLSPKTPPVSPDSPGVSCFDDDLDSLHSYSSIASGMSCDHPYVARNGTTFSGRKMKYVVHCSSHAGQTEEYLTPTQRAQRQIRRLKELLSHARMDLESRDSEILRLTREVVELRLFKASLSSPDEHSKSSDAVTVRENTTNDANTPSSSHDISPLVDQIDEGLKLSPRHALHNHGIHQVQFMDKISNSEMQSSFADSGHFEDITTSSIHSKDDSFVHTRDQAVGDDEDLDLEKQRLISMYEARIEELIQQHNNDVHETKTGHNDRIEALLQKLADSNSRYCDLVPDYEQAKERIRELEKQLEKLQAQLGEQEDKANKIYLHMYAKGQEAERLQHAKKVVAFAQQSPNRVSVPELIQQLQVTQDELENLRTMYKRLVDAQQTKNKVDPEITLQFLKSAIYYFLTDKENSQGHLNAIESILGFSEHEKLNIDKARTYK